MRCLSLGVETLWAQWQGLASPDWQSGQERSPAGKVLMAPRHLPPGMSGAPQPLTLAMRLMRAGEVGWLRDGGRGWWSSVERGILVVAFFVNPDSTLADGVQFDTGSAWGGCRRDPGLCAGHPFFPGQGWKLGLTLNSEEVRAFPSTCGV